MTRLRAIVLGALLLSLLLGGVAPARAETLEIKVLGMVCAFCAQGIEKQFRALPEVADISVDLGTKLVAVVLKPGAALDDATATGVITDAGYATAAITRTERTLEEISAAPSP